jgi:hypothetical protein
MFDGTPGDGNRGLRVVLTIFPDPAPGTPTGSGKAAAEPPGVPGVAATTS